MEEEESVIIQNWSSTAECIIVKHFGVPRSELCCWLISADVGFEAFYILNLNCKNAISLELLWTTYCRTRIQIAMNVPAWEFQEFAVEIPQFSFPLLKESKHLIWKYIILKLISLEEF